MTNRAIRRPVSSTLCNTIGVTARSVDDIIFARECISDGRAREIRERNRLSRQAMATQLGVSVGALVKWEHHQTEPSDPNAERYGALLRRLDALPQPKESETA